VDDLRGLFPYQRLSLRHRGGFFVLETPKVLLLLALVVSGVGVARSCFPPDRARRVKEVDIMLLQILGPGCPKCRKLAEVTEETAKKLGLEYRMEKITDIQAIIGFGVMMTPALAVDGVVKVSGKVPSAEEIRKILSV
jgi:small redox-active disulfide protein 2